MIEPVENNPPPASSFADLHPPPTLSLGVEEATTQTFVKEPSPMPASISSQYLWPAPFNHPDYTSPPIPAVSNVAQNERILTDLSGSAQVDSFAQEDDRSAKIIDFGDDSLKMGHFLVVADLVEADCTSLPEDEENILTEAEKAELANAVLPESMLAGRNRLLNGKEEMEITFTRAEAPKDVESDSSSSQQSPAIPASNGSTRLSCIFNLLLVGVVLVVSIFAAVRPPTMPSSALVSPTLAPAISSSSPTVAPTSTYDHTSPTFSPSVSNDTPTTFFPSLTISPAPSVSTLSPTSALCRDDRTALVFINPELGNHTCAWLSHYPGHTIRLCRDDHPVGRARWVCRRLCQTCRLQEPTNTTTPLDDCK
jgi:hypothetical protein